jgi:hypothetical protein
VSPLSRDRKEAVTPLTIVVAWGYGDPVFFLSFERKTAGPRKQRVALRYKNDAVSGHYRPDILSQNKVTYYSS